MRHLILGESSAHTATVNSMRKLVKDTSNFAKLKPSKHNSSKDLANNPSKTKNVDEIVVFK